MWLKTWVMAGLMVLAPSNDAVEAVTEMQRLHSERIKTRCGNAIVALRRQECVLLVGGEIALGATF